MKSYLVLKKYIYLSLNNYFPFQVYKSTVIVNPQYSPLSIHMVLLFLLPCGDCRNYDIRFHGVQEVLLKCKIFVYKFDRQTESFPPLQQPRIHKEALLLMTSDRQKKQHEPEKEKKKRSLLYSKSHLDISYHVFKTFLIRFIIACFFHNTSHMHNLLIRLMLHFNFIKTSSIFKIQ